MDIRTINDEYAVTAQISLDDLSQIKAQGFKSIVCHRPDAEDPGQPDFAVLSLEYVPDRLCVELKALKLYIWSFRGEGAFQPPWNSACLSTIHAPHSAPARCSLRSKTPT